MATKQNDTEKLVQKVNEVIKESRHAMFITYDEQQCGLILKGEPGAIAEAIFTSMHNENPEIGKFLYQVCKQLVLNLITQETPHSVDLIESILNKIPDDYDE